MVGQWKCMSSDGTKKPFIPVLFAVLALIVAGFTAYIFVGEQEVAPQAENVRQDAYMGPVAPEVIVDVDEPAVRPGVTREPARLANPTPEPVNTRGVKHPMKDDVKTLSDDDGDFTVEYQDHTVVTSSPQVLAVLAAPPYVEGLNMEDDATTSYGKSQTVGGSIGAEVGVHFGFAVGIEYEAELFGLAAGASVQTAVEAEITASVEASQSTTIGVSYTCEGTDYVIYNSQTFDVYHYIITDHYDPALINTSMTVCLPTGDDPITHITPVKEYNKMEGIDYTIGLETFRHTPGKPGTYPTEAAKNRIMWEYGRPWEWTKQLTLEAGWAVPKQEVGKGSGFTTVTIDLAQEVTSGLTTSYRVTDTVGVKAGVFTAEASFGVHGSASVSASYGHNTVYEGSIPYLPEDAWDEHKYSYGMFVYNYQRLDGHGYQVVNYYVDGYDYKEDVPVKPAGVDPAPVPEVFDEGVLGYWNHEDGSTIMLDSSGRYEDGALFGPGYTEGVNGGKALSFDGIDDYAIVKMKHPSSQYTYSLWFRTTDDTTGLAMINNLYRPTHGPLFTHWPNYYMGLSPKYSCDRNLFINNGNISHRVMYDLTWETYFETSKTNRTIPTDQWHHLAVVMAGGEGSKIYLDGRVVAQGTYGTSELPYCIEELHGDWYDAQKVHYMVLGLTYTHGNGYDYFNGSMDDILLVGTALNESTIYNLSREYPSEKPRPSIIDDLDDDDTSDDDEKGDDDTPIIIDEKIDVNETEEIDLGGDEKVNVTVNDADTTDGTVTVDIGEEKNVELEEGKTVKVDTDGDGKVDTKVTLTGFDPAGAAELRFESMPGGGGDEEKEGISDMVLYVIVGVVAAVIIVLIVFMMSRKGKGGKKGGKKGGGTGSSHKAGKGKGKK